MATTKTRTASGSRAASKKNVSKSAKKNKTAKKTTEKKYNVPAYIITMCLVTILLAVLMYIDYGEGGIINTAVKNACCGLFGVCGYFVPLLSAGVTAYLVKTKNVKRFWLKLGLAFLLLINVSAIVNLSTPETSYSVYDAFAFGYTVPSGGGFLGACVSIFLESMVQKIASYIILGFTLIILASFLTHVSIFGETVRLIKSLIDDARVRREERDLYEYEYEYTEDKDNVYRHTESSDIIEAANSFANDTRKEKKKSSKRKKAENTELNEDILKDKNSSNGIDEIFGDTEYPIPASKKKVTTTENEPVAAEDQIADVPDEKKTKKRTQADRTEKISDAEKNKISRELDKANEHPTIEYVRPPVKLLNTPAKQTGDKREEMRNTAGKLISVLEDFGVKAKLVQVTQGPTVTRYEIQPETGTKLAKIVGLADDIALNLAVSTVLVAPVPGKAAIGIEIPNSNVSVVSVREMIESAEFRNAKSKLTVALGKDIGGNVVIGNIAKMPHVLIAGSTNSGKSVCINTIIMSILFKATPDEVRLIMVDPKEVELSVYNGIPHLLVPVVSDPKKAAGSLNWAVTEMERRYKLLAEASVRNLDGYNKIMESTGGEKLPLIVIIIDELADLMMVAAKEVETYICRIAQKARAAGIHLILATQRPSADVITGLIRTNVPSRIAFAVATQIDSRIILDSGGAEKLLGRGDMLYHPIGANASTRVQGAFVSDDEVNDVVAFIKEHCKENSYSEDLAEEIERHASGENGVTPDVEEDGDPLLKDAIELAVNSGQISTSMVQRKLGVGYARAGRIIDQMETRGIISGANGAKPREVLISSADFYGVTDTHDEDYDGIAADDYDGEKDDDEE